MLMARGMMLLQSGFRRSYKSPALRLVRQNAESCLPARHQAASKSIQIRRICRAGAQRRGRRLSAR